MFHLVDDAPLPVSVVLPTLAAAIGAPPPPSALKFTAQYTVKDPSHWRLLTSSCLTSSAVRLLALRWGAADALAAQQFRRTFPEFTFKFPTWEQGLRQSACSFGVRAAN